ncbi:unnamed protein product [Allacma fusca]|uniref:Uncharacterized protein n=1 Tax=Allacma fusca TaxID=39272 RepID=A0A8J2P1Y7_9HEXA|nr:unnamed protein product [Allacma fusca]
MYEMKYNSPRLSSPCWLPSTRAVIKPTISTHIPPDSTYHGSPDTICPRTCIWTDTFTRSTTTVDNGAIRNPVKSYKN